MRTQNRPTPLSISAFCCIALAVLLPGAASGAPAGAAEECLSAPNAAPPAGQHWWYRTDRASKRKCWYLGPQDKNSAARKADRQEQAQERVQDRAQDRTAPEPRTAADDGAGAAASAPAAPSAPAARSGAAAVPSLAQVPQESVPYLVDWSDMLEEAGIVSSGDTALTNWAQDKDARSAFAMRKQGEEETIEPQVRKDEARAPQTPAASSDVTGSAARNPHQETGNHAASTPAGIPVAYIAALLIACGVGPAIFGLLRTQRRRHAPRHEEGRAADALGRALPAFLQQHDARPFPAGQHNDHGVARTREEEQHGRGYGGEAELRRILGLPQRDAA